MQLNNTATIKAVKLFKTQNELSGT